jgi:hypothetical protein
METLNSINEQLSFYRNSEYKWVRELTTSYERYFDENFRDFLTFSEFSEFEIRQIFLYSLNTLYTILSDNNYYWYTDSPKKFNDFLFMSNHPASNKEESYNNEKVGKLFDFITLPIRIQNLRITKLKQDFYKQVSDNINAKEANKQLTFQNEGFMYAIKEFRGESENKDRIIEVQNRMIVKLRKGIDEEGGLDKIKSLVDKCYKRTATEFEKLQAKNILERVADECRNNHKYKKLVWAKFGKELKIHPSTAKSWARLFGITQFR